MLIQHLVSTNDVNGNPRRLFLIMGHEGSLLAVVDEGHAGRDAIQTGLDAVGFGKGGWRPNRIELPEIEVPPSFYRALLRGNAPWKVVHS